MNGPRRIVVVASPSPGWDGPAALSSPGDLVVTPLEHGTRTLDPRTGATLDLPGDWTAAVLRLEQDRSPIFGTSAGLELVLHAEGPAVPSGPAAVEWAVRLETLVALRGRPIDRLVLGEGFLASFDLMLEMSEAATCVSARNPQLAWVDWDARTHPSERVTDPLLSLFFQLGRWLAADPRAADRFRASLQDLPDPRPWLDLDVLVDVVVRAGGPEGVRQIAEPLRPERLPLGFPRGMDHWIALRPILRRSRLAREARTDRVFDLLFPQRRLAA